MIISHNYNAADLLRRSAQASRTLQGSATRLATGDKFAAPGNTGGRGVAGIKKADALASKTYLNGMVNALGYATMKEEVLKDVTDMLARVAELAAAGSDANKTAAELDALEIEAQTLTVEIQNLADNDHVTYNDTNLFDTAFTYNLNINGGTIVLSAVGFAALAADIVSGISMYDATSSASTFARMQSRMASLAVLQAQAGAQVNRVNRSIDQTKGLVNAMNEAAADWANVDIAEESQAFITQQILASASESVLAQANTTSQNAARFLQF